MTSARQLTAAAVFLALAGCAERTAATGKAPENIPREHEDPTKPKPAKPDRETAYQQREVERRIQGDTVEKAAPSQARIGVATTRMFHLPDCPSLKDVPTSEQIRFTSPFDAVDAGYTPCRSCNPMR
jgi:hypothetical protein